MTDTETLARCSAREGAQLLGQLPQTRYRQRLVDAWHISPGSRLLEIGCGQGDTTAALADAAGANGFVTAVDRASRDCGSPVTLGEAAARLDRSMLGARIEFRFDFDLLDPMNEFAPGAFDAAVFSHSLWYMKDESEIARSLRQVRRWARRLYVAEWDLQARRMEQVPHMLAALIQGRRQAFQPNPRGNIRALAARVRVKELIAAAGWSIGDETTVDTSGMQDGAWEVAASLDETGDRVLPPAVAALAAAERETLRSLAAARSPLLALDAYALVAEPALEGEGSK